MMNPAETRGFVAACRLFARLGVELIDRAPRIPPPANARSSFAAELQITGSSIIEAANQVYAAGTSRDPAELGHQVAAAILSEKTGMLEPSRG